VKQREGLRGIANRSGGSATEACGAAGGIGNGQGIRKALLAGGLAAALGTRFVATVEVTLIRTKARNPRGLRKGHGVDICFRMVACHARVCENRTFVMWDAAGCPSPWKKARRGRCYRDEPDGSKVLRYGLGTRGGARGDEGAVTECPLWAGLA